MTAQSTGKSPKLVVVVATCNRLDQLKVSVESIIQGTRAEMQLVVADGGSADGTQQYLLDHPRITPMLQGAKLGPGRSYNEAWRQVDGDYTCWLSDDTELVPGALDRALDILQGEPKIGMVGLKTRDTMGPFVNEPYIGGISEFGIINCNHGVLPMGLLRDVGYFNEAYRFYFIDPDLTARILCAGRDVVMTRPVSVLHHRAWSQTTDPVRRNDELSQGVDNAAIYRQAFGFLREAGASRQAMRQRAPRVLDRVFRKRGLDARVLGLCRRDVGNIVNAWFTSLSDPLRTLGKPYHLVQSIPPDLLDSPGNPCRALLLNQPAAPHVRGSAHA